MISSSSTLSRKKDCFKVIEIELNKLFKRLATQRSHYRHSTTRPKSSWSTKDSNLKWERVLCAVLSRNTSKILLQRKLLMHPDEGRKCLVSIEGDHLTFVDQEVFPRHKEIMEVKEKEKVKAEK